MSNCNFEWGDPFHWDCEFLFGKLFSEIFRQLSDVATPTCVWQEFCIESEKKSNGLYLDSGQWYKSSVNLLTLLFFLHDKNQMIKMKFPHVFTTIDSSPESNYVPGSFSAKGRAKLRPTNGASTNFDNTSLQVNRSLYSGCMQIIVSNSNRVNDFIVHRRFPIG